MRRSVLLLCLILGLAPLHASGASIDLLETDNANLRVSTSRGLRLRVLEPELDLRIGGRLHVDAAFFDDDVANLRDDVDIRRGRPYATLEIAEQLKLKIEYEFGPFATGWRNVWARWEPIRGLRIKAGNFVAPFGLQEVGSSNDLVLMERSLASALAPNYGTGASLLGNGSLGDDMHHWSVHTAITTEPFGRRREDRHGSGYWASTTRVSYAPIASPGRVLHLAGSVEYRDVGSGGYRVSTRPEASLARRFLDTGRLVGVRDVVNAGGEVAAVFGPLSLQGEYLRSWIERGALGSPVFDGWYAQASVLLTGESRRYAASRGVFTGVVPDSKWGALELAARYGELDLNSAGVVGGSEENVAAGLNWYIRRNVRWMFNYVHVDARRRGTLARDQPEVFQMRFSIFF